MDKFEFKMTLVLAICFLPLVCVNHANASSWRDVNKITFIGNSITYHGKLDAIGWMGSWGMAATSGAADYVHVVCSAIKKYNTNVNCQAVNMATFERDYEVFNYDVVDSATADADIVIVQLGDNVGSGNPQRFTKAFRQLISHIKTNNPDFIICLSNWFKNEDIDKAKREVVSESDVIFIDIGYLAEDRLNVAKYGHPEINNGVGQHPSDKGMRAIAMDIIKAIEAKYEKP